MKKRAACINNSANLLCKYPAAVNDTYTADNGFILTDFMVKKVNDTMPFGAIGNLAINYYEGYLSAQPPPPAIVEKIWYNANVWIAQRYYYKKPLLGNFYYRSASLILQDIVY